MNAAMYSRTMEIVNDVNMKKCFLFNCYHKDCILKLKEKTTGRTEVDNRHLKQSGVNIQSTFTKLVSTDKMKNNIRENNIQFNSNYVNRSNLSSKDDLFHKVANKLTAYQVK